MTEPLREAARAVMLRLIAEHGHGVAERPIWPSCGPTHEAITTLRAALAASPEGLGVEQADLDWLMTLIIARASNAEYHRAKSILLRIGARHLPGIDAANADAALASQEPDHD